MLTIVTIINIILLPKSVINLTGFNKSVNIHAIKNTNQNINCINQNINCIKNINTLAIIAIGGKIGIKIMSIGSKIISRVSSRTPPPFKLVKHSIL